MAREEENRDMRIESGAISVSINKGEATLEGKVGSLQKKKLAEEHAMEVSGVVRVHNKLEVETEGTYSDEKIHSIILGEIDKADNFHLRQFQLEVKDGLVWIKGTVPHYVERKRIIDIIQHIPGVLDIENRVVVNRK